MSDATKDPADAAWEEARRLCPPRYSVWKHRKRGTHYEIVGPTIIEDGMKPAVNYCEYNPRSGRLGKQWTRPLSEFLDGRFEEGW